MIENIEEKLKIWNLIEERLYEVFNLIKNKFKDNIFREYDYADLTENGIKILWTNWYDECTVDCSSIIVPFEYFSGEKDINEFISKNFNN